MFIHKKNLLCEVTCQTPDRATWQSGSGEWRWLRFNSGVRMQGRRVRGKPAVSLYTCSSDAFPHPHFHITRVLPTRKSGVSVMTSLGHSVALRDEDNHLRPWAHRPGHVLQESAFLRCSHPTWKTPGEPDLKTQLQTAFWFNQSLHIPWY